MKNFNIQKVLAAMMLVMVFVASRPVDDEKLLLEQIKDEANKTRHNNTLVGKRISWLETNGSEPCWTEIFCLAEQALKKTDYLEKSHLTLLLHKYNRNHPEISCHLEGNHEINITRFLKIVGDCADKFSKHRKE